MIDYIDGPNRLIYLDSSSIDAEVHPIEIYREMRTLRRTDEELRKYDLFMAFKGADKKNPSGSKRTERYGVLLDGTLIIPYDTSHFITVTGTIITDDGLEGVDCFKRDTLSVGTEVDINYVPKQVEIITINTSGASAQEVWEYPTRTLTSGAASGDVNVVSVDGIPVNSPSDFGATPAEITENLLTTDIHAFTGDLTIGEAFHRLRHFTRFVYVNTDNDVNGDGSDGFPFNNVNDAKDYAEVHQITNIVATGDIVIPSPIKNMTIHGVGLPRVDFNGQNAKGSKFLQCSLGGSYIDSIIAEECQLEDGLLLRGHFKSCELAGSYIVAPDSHTLLFDCVSGIPGPDYSTISMNSGQPTSASIRSYHGGLHITNADHLDDIITVEIAEGKLEFESSCTQGTMVARGDCAFIDNTTGSLVIDETSYNFISDEHTVTKNTVIVMS